MPRGRAKHPAPRSSFITSSAPLQMIGSWSYIDATQAAPDGSREPAPARAPPLGRARRHSGKRDARPDRPRGELHRYAGTGRRSVPHPEQTVHPGQCAGGNPLQEGFSVFLNAVNLTGTRQTHYDPLVRPHTGMGRRSHHRCLGTPGWPHVQHRNQNRAAGSRPDCAPGWALGRAPEWAPENVPKNVE